MVKAYLKYLITLKPHSLSKSENKCHRKAERGRGRSWVTASGFNLRLCGERTMRVISECGIVDLMNENAEEGGGLVILVLLEVGMGLADQRGGGGGKQTSL